MVSIVEKQYLYRKKILVKAMKNDLSPIFIFDRSPYLTLEIGVYIAASC